MPEVGQWGPQPLIGRNGRVIRVADVFVYETDGTTLATLYDDQTGTTTLANPLPIGVDTEQAGLDELGNVNFYAVPGPYEIAVDRSGEEVYRSPITVAIDTAGAGAGTVTSVNGVTPDITGDVDLPAADVPFTPGGTIAATDVQAAILEAASESGPPSGPAGGVLSGTYPDPGFAVDMATQAELDAVAATIPTTEGIQDVTGGMVTGNVETGIAVTYDDTNGKLDFVAEVTQAELDLKADLADPTFTGTPDVPTAAVGTNTTQIASTAFVLAEIADQDQLAEGDAIVIDPPAGGFVVINVATEVSNRLFTADQLEDSFVHSSFYGTGDATTETLTADRQYLAATQTLTLDYATPRRVPLLVDTSTNLWLQAGAGNVGYGLIETQAVVGNDPAGTNISPSGGRVYSDAMFWQADTDTIALGSVVSFRSAPTFRVVNSGTISSGTYTGFGTPITTATGVTMATITCHNTGVMTLGGVHTTVNHFKANNPTVTGTVTTQYGLDIDALAGATTNVGLRNAAATVLTPVVRTLTAVGNSLSATTDVRGSVIRLDNTSGGSLTLTSAPTLPDGADGQRVLIFNGSAQNVVLSDQGTLASSNLRLSAATITLATRDSIELVYSSTVGDWIQVAEVNVI